MYLILLIFCTCGHVSNADDSSDDDEGKFIDLLPKEEKDAFIETVARRLITGVKTKDSRYKSDEEVSDESLNQHSQYVRTVLQEESSNLRRDAKIKRNSDEKIVDQGDNKNSHSVKIQDDEAKYHIDLTLRQGNRSKRHEKTFNMGVDNEEIIPVKTIYDDENDRITETKSNTKVNADGNEDTRTKSKERLAENSATDDIQVRGIKSYSKKSRLAKTKDLNLQESTKDATMIVDFEPEGSQEHVQNSNESKENPTTDSINLSKTKTTTDQEVKISSETTDDVESSQRGFTVPIYAPQQSDYEEGKSSKESVETDKTTTVIIETTTKPKNVEETSKIGDLGQNKTSKQKYLRDNLDDENLNKKSENRSSEIEKVINNTSERIEKKILRRFDATTSKVDDVIRVLKSEVKYNEHFDSSNNDTNLMTENKNYTSSDHDQVINFKSDLDTEIISNNLNKSDDKDETVSSTESTTTANAIPNDGLENKVNMTEVGQKLDVSVNNETHFFLKQGDETNKSGIQSAGLNKDKDGNVESSTMKITAEDNKLEEREKYFTTTEISEQDNKKLYITEEVDSSYIPSKVGNLRSNMNSSSQEVDTIKSTQNKIYDITDNPQYVKFEKVPNYGENVLTTEKNLQNNPSESSSPKYSIYYSKYVSRDDDNKEKVLIEYKKDEADEAKDKKVDNKLKYESQAVNLENIAKALRQRLLSQEEYEQSLEVKPKLLQSTGKIKEYLVYEIPANEPPFERVKPEPKLEFEGKEQPYYVPVYNYAPSNAYYNAYNLLGPNDNEEITPDVYEKDRYNDESVDLRPKTLDHFFEPIRVPDDHRNFKFNTINKHSEKVDKLKTMHTSNNLMLPLVVKKPKFTEIHFNPDEYLDMDYYFERGRDKSAFKNRNKRLRTKKTGKSFFPNSDEEGHPYNSMSNKKVKNHINAVRQMMYQQKQFGFITTTTTPKSHVHSDSSKHPEPDVHDHTPDQPEPNEQSQSYEDTERRVRSHTLEHPEENEQSRSYEYPEQRVRSHILEHPEENDHSHSYEYPEPEDGSVKPSTLRARDRSDYIILISNDKHQSYNPDRKDITSDYYFGVYNTGDSRDGKIYGGIQRGGREFNMYNRKGKKQKKMLSDLVGKIRRLQKGLNTKKFARKKMQKENKNKENWKKNAGTIKDILEIGEEKDAFVNLKKLEELGLNVMRRRSDEEVQVYVNVLQDMVKMENRALEKFDWLGSTVDILGAVRKLKYLTQHKQAREDLAPADIQLLNYVLYLFKISKSFLKDLSKEEPSLRYPKDKKNVLPRNKHRKKKYLSAKLLNRVWFNIRHNTPDSSSNEKSYKELEKLEELEFLAFLDDLKNNLHDLHNSIKHIAIVTKYKNQQWFTNLKLLYLKTTEQKVLLEILLHIFTSRLLELIEKSVENGLEDGYLKYVAKEEKEVEKTKEEFVFVLKFLKEIKKFDN